jgi:hypothetical protein
MGKSNEGGYYGVRDVCIVALPLNEVDVVFVFERRPGYGTSTIVHKP